MDISQNIGFVMLSMFVLAVVAGYSLTMVRMGFSFLGIVFVWLVAILMVSFLILGLFLASGNTF